MPLPLLPLAVAPPKSLLQLDHFKSHGYGPDDITLNVGPRPSHLLRRGSEGTVPHLAIAHLLTGAGLNASLLFNLPLFSFVNPPKY